MNKNHYGYFVGKLNPIPQWVYLGMTGVMTKFFINGLMDLNPVLLGISGYFGTKFALETRNAFKLNRRYKKLLSDSESVFTEPLEHVNKFIIEDKKGLERLLSRTTKDEEFEWGTFFKSKFYHGKAIIYEIHDSENKEVVELFENKGKDKLKIDIAKAKKQGYTGSHHFHTSFRFKCFDASNFVISPYDRVNPVGWLNLLTFNLPDGPEIIGYNLRNVYIPNSDSKTELVKTTPRDIRDYLSSRYHFYLRNVCKEI